jgi:hypothetical protein
VRADVAQEMGWRKVMEELAQGPKDAPPL